MQVVIKMRGAPVAKGRPRFGTLPGGAPTTFTPAKTRKYEAALKLAADVAMNGRPPMLGAVRMDIKAVIPIPKSWSKKKRAAALEGQVSPTSRPDLDNYAKLAGDAINEIVFKDDSQVSILWICKVYGEIPGLIIRVREI